MSSLVTKWVDPAGARNFVSIWAAVNEEGDIFIAREWPDRDTFGEWALFGDPKWRYGPASKKIGLNVEDMSISLKRSKMA